MTYMRTYIFTQSPTHRPKKTHFFRTISMHNCSITVVSGLCGALNFVPLRWCTDSGQQTTTTTTKNLAAILHPSCGRPHTCCIYIRVPPPPHTHQQSRRLQFYGNLNKFNYLCKLMRAREPRSLLPTHIDSINGYTFARAHTHTCTLTKTSAQSTSHAA